MTPTTITKIPESVLDTKGKTVLSGKNTGTKQTTCSPKQFQISYHFELSWEKTLIYQPGKWCPCLWSEPQSGTLAYCICSYLESPDACGQNNQFCPLKITTGKQPCDFAFQLRTNNFLFRQGDRPNASKIAFNLDVNWPRRLLNLTWKRLKYALFLITLTNACSNKSRIHQIAVL